MVLDGRRWHAPQMLSDAIKTGRELLGRLEALFGLLF